MVNMGVNITSRPQQSPRPPNAFRGTPSSSPGRYCVHLTRGQCLYIQRNIQTQVSCYPQLFPPTTEQASNSLNLEMFPLEKRSFLQVSQKTTKLSLPSVAAMCSSHSSNLVLVTEMLSPHWDRPATPGHRHLPNEKRPQQFPNTSHSTSSYITLATASLPGCLHAS